MAMWLLRHSLTLSRERLEGTRHARVAAARLAWQFPYDRKLQGRLWRINVPALVIWGEHDRLVPMAHGQAIEAFARPS